MQPHTPLSVRLQLFTSLCLFPLVASPILPSNFTIFALFLCTEKVQWKVSKISSISLYCMESAFFSCYGFFGRRSSCLTPHSIHSESHDWDSSECCWLLVYILVSNYIAVMLPTHLLPTDFSLNENKTFLQRLSWDLQKLLSHRRLKTGVLCLCYAVSYVNIPEAQVGVQVVLTVRCCKGL